MPHHPVQAEARDAAARPPGLPALEGLFRAADAHAADASDLDYAVGDLQELLRAAWRLLTPARRAELFAQPGLTALAELPEYGPLIGHLIPRLG